MNASNSPSSRSLAFALAVAALVDAVLVALAAHEWARLSSPAASGAYHFGSEAMVGAGGRLFLSEGLYRWYQLGFAFVGAALVVASVAAVLRGIRGMRLVLLGGIAAQLITDWALRHA